MKMLLNLGIAMLLVGCMNTAPPSDVKGKWVGWAEPAMDTKTGITLEIKQEGNKISGDYEAQQVSNLGGEERSKSTFTGTVSGDELSVKFSKCDFEDVDADVDVPLKLTKEGDKQVLAGVYLHEGGLGTKYHFEKR